MTLCVLLLNACSTSRTVQTFSGNEGLCFSRTFEPWTFAVDSHLHPRAFNHDGKPLSELLDYLKSSGVLFTNLYGIGQTLPQNSECRFFSNCPGVPVTPSIANDIENARQLQQYKGQDVHVTLSMSFFDLNNPQTIVPGIKQLDLSFPGMFRWAGEVNLVKQALFANGHQATGIDKIPQWSDFMALLRQRNIPLAVHSDLGNNDNPTQYLHLMQQVLSQYPDNHIVWVHMGLSRELTRLSAEQHIAIMQRMLDSYPKLMLDISWKILWQYQFSQPDARDRYIAFLNHNSQRILTGSDLVASSNTTLTDYKKLVKINSQIHRQLDDQAFRRIVLGQNYFDLLGLKYKAPRICQ